MIVREATADDAAACVAIYAPYVADTAITFEAEPPAAAEMAARIRKAQEAHSWLVADDGGLLLGYAYASSWKGRPAYRWSCEVTVYVAGAGHRRGTGRALYEALFERLAARGYRTLLAGVTLPNEASLGLHRALGFDDVGTFRRIGWKLGDWQDVHYLTRTIGPRSDDPPAEPR